MRKVHVNSSEIMTTTDIEKAVLAAHKGTMDDLCVARELAERIGYNAFREDTVIPFIFAEHQFLREGFYEGYDNAKCERELIRMGLL